MKKFLLIIFIVGVGVTLFFFKEELLGNKDVEKNEAVSTDELVVTNFEGCVSDPNNPIMESFPRQCRDIKTGNLFTEENKTNGGKLFCNDDQKKADVCVELYEPVCAVVNIQCIKAPCNPIKQTFSNSCEACINPLVESYEQGTCGSF